MRCKDCVFCWKDEDEKYPSCKFEVRTVWDIPPCEYEDDYKEEEWMPTYTEIIEELFALFESVANSGAMLDEKVDTLERLTNEYYILKSMEKSE